MKKRVISLTLSAILLLPCLMMGTLASESAASDRIDFLNEAFLVETGNQLAQSIDGEDSYPITAMWDEALGIYEQDMASYGLWFGNTIYFRVDDSSDWEEVNIPERPEAPQGVAGGEGVITGVTAAMEYRLGEGDWTACTGETVEGLSAGAYEVRYCSTESAFASQSASVTVTGSAAPLDLSSASVWAHEILNNANSVGLITSRTNANFTADITRLQFAELAVNLIEKATGTTLPTGEQSFTDTSDPEALKAAQAGITSGTGNGGFSPDASITRQEICVMLRQVIRCVDEANGTTTLTNEDTAVNSQITDAGDIDSWAVESMALINNNGLMSGSDNMLFPKSSTSIEQAITMILALYNKF